MGEFGGRARKAPATVPRPRVPPPALGAFPAPRERSEAGDRRTAEKYGFYETSPEGWLAVPDVEAELVRFSGKPDMIRVSARGNDALLKFVDETGRGTDFIMIAFNPGYEYRLGAKAIRGKELNAGGGAEIFVEAFYAVVPPAQDPVSRS